ncbi:MAG: AI-2E family transporter [Muribaculaceae bacterium]|nr:AI-2E family transporter [Muribaculaceae bacterium]
MPDSLQRTPYTFDRVVRIFFTVCGLMLALYLLYVLKGVLLPFMVAMLLAYMMEPIVLWNRRWTRCKKRFIPVMLTLLEVVTVLAVFASIFVPYLIQEASQMADAIKQYASTQVDIPFISKEIHEFIQNNINFEELSKYLTQEQWGQVAQKVISSSWSVVSSSVGFIWQLISWLIVLLYLVFIMLDYERLTLSFKQLVPFSHRKKVFKIFDDIKVAMNRYFRGQFLIASLVGVLFSIGFVIIGLPMGVLFGLFIGVLNMVPYLQLISLPICFLLCLVATVSGGVAFWPLLWESLAVYVVVQLIQDLLLTPKIMGKAMGLNPAIILLSLSIWGCLLGFLGLIIALPLTTLILSYYDLYVVQRMQYKTDPEHKEPPEIETEETTSDHKEDDRPSSRE